MTTNLKEEHLRPYFLWDESVTIGQLRDVLRSGTEEERLHYMAKILRDARYEDVWEFLTVRDLVENWDKLCKRLGQRRRFWEFLLTKWRQHGLIK